MVVTDCVISLTAQPQHTGGSSPSCRFWNTGSTAGRLESRVKITSSSNNTDVSFIDKISNKVIKRIEMVDLIEDAVLELQNLKADMSACRFLSFFNKKLYVVDLGLDCVFILN